MKLKSVSALSIAVLLTLTSCNLFSDEYEEKWSDKIKLSQKKTEFSADGDSVLIATGGKSWWINHVNVDGKTFFDKNRLSQDTVNFYQFKDDCFTIERRTRNSLFIKLDENTTSKPREVFVRLQAGNYFDGVKVSQKGKVK